MDAGAGYGAARNHDGLGDLLWLDPLAPVRLGHGVSVALLTGLAAALGAACRLRRRYALAPLAGLGVGGLPPLR